MKMMVEIMDKRTTIHFEDQGVIMIHRDLKKPIELSEQVVLLYCKAHEVHTVDYGQEITKNGLKASDSLITVRVPWEFEGQALAQQMIEAWQKNGLKVSGLFTIKKIAKNHAAAVANYQQELFEIFATFGFENEKRKKQPAKAQHRWNKTVSEIPFFIDHSDSKGEVIWRKRDEMVLKAGAQLKQETPLNKDGSVGFSARFAEKLRADHANQLSGFVTTEDIVFKSVNEVGIFLYYAGTNGWLVLKDKEGKTIHEYTVVT